MDDLERTLLTSYLRYWPNPPLSRPTSTLCLALRDCRNTTGRDSKGRLTDANAEHGMTLLAALGYLCVLDQLGTAVKPRNETTTQRRQLEQLGKPTSVRRRFSAPLVWFKNLQASELAALYALRCSLAHDYSLMNVPKNQPDLTHFFSLEDDQSLVIRLPKKRWDGSQRLPSDTTDFRTIVGLPALGTLVESVVDAIVDAHRNDQLKLAIPSEEFRMRYFVWESIMPA